MEENRETENKVPEKKAAARLVSVDALRGFDMFWLIGGLELFKGIVKLFKDPIPAAISRQMTHPGWGPSVSCYDLIMPLFLFIVGVAMVFSLGKQLEGKRNWWRIYGRIFKRFALLWLLGMVSEGNLLMFDMSKLRLAGNVLEYIAASYLICSVALLHLRVRGQLVLTVALLLGYCLLMLYVPIPGKAAGILTREVNLARYIDSLFIAQHFHSFGSAPIILSSMAMAGTMLIGIMAGHILKLQALPWRKVGYLAAAGAGCLLVGWLWSFWFMMVKWIWTSSFALWMAGWSFLLLALFYMVIDVLGYKRWAFPFVVIGSNSIFAYVFIHVYGRELSKPLLRGLMDHMGVFKDFTFAAGHLAILWLILWYLYRNKTFLRV